MYGIRVAKEIMHIAQYFLVGTYKEYTEVVGLILAQGVYGQGVRVVAIGYERGYLAITVAGDILNSGVTCRPFVKSLDRHDGEELVDGPAVGEALEQREIAEILIG